jgi:4-amino-4-deoxy-L-arabinose transferase-like glycosyltransferase
MKTQDLSVCIRVHTWLHDFFGASRTLSFRKRHVPPTTRPQKQQQRRAAADQFPPPNPPRYDRLTIAIGLLVTAVAGCLYWASCARDVVVGDTPEYITAAITLGVPHPSGYPLLVMLGHLFSMVLPGPLPFRVNLLSVVCSAATAGIVYFTAFRLTGERAAAAVGALVLASSPLFWEWSLVAEVFPLNCLLAATLIHLLVLWNDHPRQSRWLIAAAFVAGLSITNQLTIVLLAPAVLFLLLRNRAVLLARPLVIAACVGALLTGLLPYIYLPWAAARHPTLNWSGISSLSDFLAHFLRKSYGTGRLVSSAALMGGSPIERVLALFESFGWLMGLLLIAGAIGAYRRRRWYFWFSLSAFTFAGLAFAAYANINVEIPISLSVLERFFLLSHVAVAPLIAIGILEVAEGIAAILPGLRARAKAVVTVITLLIAAGVAFEKYSALDQRDNHIASRLGQDVLATLEPGSILLAGGDEVVLPLLYVQTVERFRPDVTLVMMPLLPADWYVRQLRERFPNLNVPFDRYNAKSGTMKDLLDANRQRPIAVIGNLLDNSPEGSYWFYRHGLVSVVEPMEKDVKLRQMVADNEQLLSRYRPPSPSAIKPRSFEPGVLTLYAAPSLAVGQELEKGRQYVEARSWYQRALAQDPHLHSAREALSRISRYQ